MYFDIHTHILPALDDGARNNQEALDMLRLAERAGTSHIVATPHDNGADTGAAYAGVIEQRCLQLASLAAENQLHIAIHSGSEVLLRPDLPQQYVAGEICTLNNTPFLLLELPYNGIPLYLDDVVYRLQLAGAVPIIAHPERNEEFFGNKKTILSLRERGVLYQCNAGSLTGLFGRAAKKTALWMLKNDMLHFIASDAHSCGKRSPDMQEAANLVAERFGQDMMHRLFHRNAEKWILGKV